MVTGSKVVNASLLRSTERKKFPTGIRSDGTLAHDQTVNQKRGQDAEIDLAARYRSISRERTAFESDTRLPASTNRDGATPTHFRSLRPTSPSHEQDTRKARAADQPPVPLRLRRSPPATTRSLFGPGLITVVGSHGLPTGLERPNYGLAVRASGGSHAGNEHSCLPATAQLGFGDEAAATRRTRRVCVTGGGG